ncbi:MAG: hypothetical protein IJA63_04000 [Akkermansia sp.]|nr:hypothetical protein [Akkermansia sp.]
MITFDCNSRPELDYHETSVHEFTPIPICFVGTRGVDKTSLLASMYYEIKKGGVNSIFIDHVNSEKGAETLVALNEAYMDMLEMIDCTEVGQMVNTLGVPASADRNIYEFIGKYKIEDKSIFSLSKFKEFRFPFHFIDFPGNWYTDNDDHNDEVTEVLENSVASFVVVDTPALMKGIATCERNNKTMLIESWYVFWESPWMTNRQIVINGAEALAKELNEKLQAGNDFNYIKL